LSEDSLFVYLMLGAGQEFGLRIALGFYITTYIFLSMRMCFC